MALPSPTEKALIRATEGSAGSCKVQFNPKELQVDKTVSWTTGPGAHSENPAQEFKEPQSSSLAVTLYFDTYEEGTDVYTSKNIAALEKMATIDEALGRPPVCLFTWSGFTFKGVVESISQKYTMFLSNGTRVRCEVAFKMKSASAATVAKRKNEGGASGGGST